MKINISVPVTTFEDRPINIPDWVVESAKGNRIAAIKMLRDQLGVDDKGDFIRLIHAKQIVDMFCGYSN